MGLKPGDIIDEKKNHEQSCGIVTKVVSGGAGFEKMECCGFELDERDLADDWNQTIDRFEGGVIKKGTLIDEGKNHPEEPPRFMRSKNGGLGRWRRL
jgi:hypothetical protein